MAFVNELIPENEKAKFSFPVSTRPDGSRPTLSWWTVDRDRSAFLVFVNSEGGGYEGTELTKHFVLSWNNHLINLSASPLGTSRTEAGVVMSWRVRGLRVPESLHADQESVLRLIREAFTTMGDIYDGEQYVAVNVDFDLASARQARSQK